MIFGYAASFGEGFAIGILLLFSREVRERLIQAVQPSCVVGDNLLRVL
jgi:hypothetical protein